MASFEFSKKGGKDVFLSCHEHETKKNFWVSKILSPSWGLRIFSLTHACDNNLKKDISLYLWSWANLLFHGCCAVLKYFSQWGAGEAFYNMYRYVKLSFASV